MTSLSSMMIWTLTPPQNRTFRWKIMIILQQIEWFDCERYRTILQKMQCKTVSKQSLISSNVYVFDIGSICLHGKELLRNFTFHQKIQGKILFQSKLFDISEKLIVGTITWDFWSVSNQLGKFSMETIISGQWRTLDTINGEPMEFEWKLFPGFTALQPVQEVRKFMNKMSDEPSTIPWTNYLHVDVQWHHLVN